MMPTNQNLQEIEIRSEDVQEILETIPGTLIRWGNTLFLVLAVLVLSLAWFIRYPDVIAGKAVITTEEAPVREYAKTSGKLTNILVENEQQVVDGQPLAIIENSAEYKDVFLLKSMLDTVKISNEHFEFPLEKLPILMLGENDDQFSLFENNLVLYQINRGYQPFSNEAETNAYKMDELRSRLKNLLEQEKLFQLELEVQQKNQERNQFLHQEGAISDRDFEARKIIYLQAERSLKTLKVSLSQTRESIRMTEINSKTIGYKKAKEELTLYKNVIQSFNALKRSMADWESKYVLKSTINGEVHFSNVLTKNKTVQTGEAIFTIIPAENSRYIAHIETPLTNSGKLKKGQAVKISVSSFPASEYGSLTGTITFISTVSNEKGNYMLQAHLKDGLTSTYGQQFRFKQEMSGNAEIITEDLRLIERFFYQFKRILSER